MAADGSLQAVLAFLRSLVLVSHLVLLRWWWRSVSLLIVGGAGASVSVELSTLTSALEMVDVEHEDDEEEEVDEEQQDIDDDGDDGSSVVVASCGLCVLETNRSASRQLMMHSHLVRRLMMCVVVGEVVDSIVDEDSIDVDVVEEDSIDVVGEIVDDRVGEEEIVVDEDDEDVVVGVGGGDGPSTSPSTRLTPMLHRSGSSSVRRLSEQVHMIRTCERTTG